jgi:hypothetical protein
MPPDVVTETGKSPKVPVLVTSLRVQLGPKLVAGVGGIFGVQLGLSLRVQLGLSLRVQLGLSLRVQLGLALVSGVGEVRVRFGLALGLGEALQLGLSLRVQLGLSLRVQLGLALVSGVGGEVGVQLGISLV